MHVYQFSVNLAIGQIKDNILEEGYIKFKAIWEKAPIPELAVLPDLQFWRAEMHRLGLIGVYENGIGYGNISCRLDEQGTFLVTGSATGNLPVLGAEHFTIVTGFDVARNTIRCTGPIIASSESMSHAVIYRHCPEANGVIHVHHARLWSFLLHRVPTTAESATYGSPEMAGSIIYLLKNTNLKQERIFAMQGHPEGVFSFGSTLREAADILRVWMAKADLLSM